MANNDEYLTLRRMTGEVDLDTSMYTNADLDIYIAKAGSLEGAATFIWGEKASTYADMVNTSEAGSSRSNSDLFKHAVEQRDHFKSITPTDDGAPVTDAAPSTTRRIVRA